MRTVIALAFFALGACAEQAPAPEQPPVEVAGSPATEALQTCSGNTGLVMTQAMVQSIQSQFRGGKHDRRCDPFKYDPNQANSFWLHCSESTGWGPWRNTWDAYFHQGNPANNPPTKNDVDVFSYRLGERCPLYFPESPGLNGYGKCTNGLANYRINLNCFKSQFVD